MISQDELKSILRYDPDEGQFYWLESRHGVTAGQRAGSNRGDGYIEVKINKKKYFAHRLVWLYVHGRWPRNVDHANLVKSDNRLCNLREASQSQNMMNRAFLGNVCGFKGVSRNGSKFPAMIKRNLKPIYLGTFETPEEAHAAYVKAAEEIHGEYARVA